MKKFWRIQDSVESDGQELILEGVVSAEEWWGDEITPKAFRDELAKINGKLTVVINSVGGEVFAGVQIYNILKARGNSTVRVEGIAGSIASVIAMAGEEIVMTPGSVMMVHKPSMGAWGNSSDMEDAQKILELLEDELIEIYVSRTGLTKEKVSELLVGDNGNGTWMGGKEAVGLGFADRVLEDEELKLTVKDAMKAMMSNKLQFTMQVSKESLEAFAKENPSAETDGGAKDDTDVTTSTDETPDETSNNTNEAEESEADKEKELEMDEKEKKAAAEADAQAQAEADAKMQKQIETAVEGIVAKALPKQPKAEKKVSDFAVRSNFVNQISALMNKNSVALSQYVKEGAELRGIENAVADGSNLWVDEVVRNDILKAYNQVGRVGTLVDRESITADTLKILVETAGVGFQPVALGAAKGTDAPTWTPVTFEPYEWAVIVPWKDGDQKRTTINIYNQIVQYIATEYAKLEDKIILTYTGGNVGSETRPATGLVPILTTAGRDIQATDYSSAEVIGALAEAYGQTESDGTITLVANRVTWAQLATSLDGMDRPLFTVVGDQVSAGALGSFRVVISSVMADGDVVIGNFADYLLVTRGGLGTLFSREATINLGGEQTLNLFQQDASALRADVDITGGAKRVNSFSLIQFLGTSS